MRRLNNRGYLIVELILASVLAMTVAYFLLNLVVKMSSKNQDLYVETALLTDKAIMTNLVMEDVNKYTLVGVSQSGNSVNFDFKDKDNNDIKKKLVVDTDDKSIMYSNEDGSNAIVKKLNSNIVKIDPQISADEGVINSGINDSLLRIKTVMNTMYSDTNFGLDITIPYNKNTLKLEPNIRVKDEYSSGLDIKQGTSSDRLIRSYFDYFPSNGNVSCSYNGTSVSTINDVISGKGIGTYRVSCNVNYNFNGSTITSASSASMDIRVSKNGISSSYDKYLYYASSVFDSQGNDTELFRFYRCNEDGSNCESLNTTAYGMFTRTTTALSYGFSIVPYDAKNRWFYSSCNLKDGVTIQEMTMHRCEGKVCSNSTFANPVGYPFAIYNVSVSSEIISNSKKVYYSAAQYSNGYRIPKMDLYVCDLDPDIGNCKYFKTADAYVFFGNSNANGTGISYQVGMAVNEKYFFYTTESSKTDTLNIVRCNYDGTDCNVIGSSYAWSSTVTGSELYPRLIADDNNLYYTSYNYETGTIYKCNEAGENCQPIVSGKGFTNNAGAGLNVGMAISSDYLFYTTYSTSYRDVIGGSIIRCTREGKNCETKVNSGATIVAGPGLEMQVTANDNYVYYTEAMQNSQNSARINKFKVYMCNEKMEECKPKKLYDGSNYIYGYSNAYTGSVIPYKMILTK